jgi:hypothetical protein
VAAGKDLKEVFADTRKVMDPVFGSVFIYEHCLPFDVSRAFDEASGIKHPRIWTASATPQWRCGQARFRPGAPSKPRPSAGSNR